jgi:glycerophosphoryl diester phosphodiesterase
MAPTLNIAHRGASSLAPENTMAAFRKAADLGADGLELDVQFSKDGKLVVIHDEQLNRTTNGKGLVKDYSLAELKELDAGSWFSPEFANETIPTLEEVLAEFQGMHINIEIKSGVILYPGIEKAVLNLVSKYKLEEKVLISSFNHYSLAECKKINPETGTGILYMAGLYEPWDYAKKLGCYSIHPLFYGVQPEIIQGCKKNGLAIYAWTVDDLTHMKALLQGGIEAIITNRPQDLKGIIDRSHNLG